MSEKDFTVMHSRNMQQVNVTQHIMKVLTLFITYAFLIVMALIVLFPFYWMIISSLKSLDEYRASVPTFWPRMVLISNYAEAFSTGNLGRLFLNTAYVGIVSTILSLIITILTAFAFARLEFKGKNALFGALLATMMIPGELFTITNYQTIFMLGWQNTYTVLIVPFLVSVFYIYLLRQNFLADSERTVSCGKGRRHERLQVPVESHGAALPADADFHHHPENDGRMELLRLAASGGE